MATRVEKKQVKVSKPLHVKYRPKTFDEVLGQKAAVSALRRMAETRKSQAFLLSGPSGCGKTTLARIAATAFGCSIVEVDAATNSGIDAMRDIQEMMRYRGFGEEAGRAIIIDEAHGLSRQAWDSLLKATEEPPEHIVWFLCTTNPTKVPATVKTRFTTLPLKAVGESDLGELLDFVCEEEKIDILSDVGDLLIREAQGSPRQLLVHLELCRGVKSTREAKELLQRAVADEPTLALCRFLMRPQSWATAMSIVKRLEGDNPEGTRIMIVNYFGAVMKNAKSDRDAIAALRVLDNFAVPYRQEEGVAPLLLGIGRAVFARD